VYSAEPSVQGMGYHEYEVLLLHRRDILMSGLIPYGGGGIPAHNQIKN